MPGPSDDSNSELEAKIASLRVELKSFEHSFLREHNRKPTDADIKVHSIAQVYKEYNHQLKKRKYWLKDVESRKHKTQTAPRSTSTSTLAPVSKLPPPPPPAPPTPKRARPNPSTPSKHTTPSRRTPTLPWDENDIYESPASVRRIRLFGNRATRDGIGPTPQKTGKVLGIFDSFTDITSTPTKSPSGLPLTTDSPDGGVFAASPSKRNVQRVSQSPCTSNGSFTTPRKRKRGLGMGELPPGLQTPTALRTPSALRQRVMADDEVLMSPPAFRPPPKLKRGLSSLVAELREMEEHAHDDEEEVMREMEMEAMGIPILKKKPEATKAKEKKSNKDMDGFDRDLGLPELPQGAWREEEVKDEAEGEVMEGRTYKKKGLKRQTKRVKMRPVTVKSKSGTAPTTVEEESEYESEYSDDDVPAPAPAATTAPAPSTPPPPARNLRINRSRGVLQAAVKSDDDALEDDDALSEEDYASSGSEFARDDDAQEDDEESTKPTKLTKQTTNQDVAALRNKERKKTLAEKSKDTVKRVARKVSATAHSHMNFQRLKIKGKGSGGGRSSGRFAKRR